MYRSKTFYCPVCKQNLGTYPIKEAVVTVCEECRVTFIFRPGVDKPESLKSTVGHCGCGGCGR